MTYRWNDPIRGFSTNRGSPPFISSASSVVSAFRSAGRPTSDSRLGPQSRNRSLSREAARTSRAAMRRSSSDLRFSQGGIATTLLRASSGLRSRLMYSTARCCSSTSMNLRHAAPAHHAVHRMCADNFDMRLDLSSEFGRPQGRGIECHRHCSMSEKGSKDSMGQPGVSVEDLLCQGPQAGILGVRNEKLQVGGQQQTLQQENGIS